MGAARERTQSEITLGRPARDQHRSLPLFSSIRVAILILMASCAPAAIFAPLCKAHFSPSSHPRGLC